MSDNVPVGSGRRAWVEESVRDEIRCAYGLVQGRRDYLAGDDVAGPELRGRYFGPSMVQAGEWRTVVVSD